MRTSRLLLYLSGFLFLLFLFHDFDNSLSDSGLASASAVLPAPAEHPVSFTEEIKPILESKCLACHSCFDAPCQLKLENSSGLLRGALKKEVYDGVRTEAMLPTRLGIDALTAADWRERGFFSVLQAGNEQLPSLMLSMITLAKQHPFSPGSKLPDSVQLGIKHQNYCATTEEFSDFANDHPERGMPFATTGLTDQEFSLLAGWLKQGAFVPEEKLILTDGEKHAIHTWESMFNREDLRGQLVGRWLYEHLFLAYLYFPELEGEPRFFELLRASTPPGEEIEPIATVSPNDDPGEVFYYRLRPVTGTIVHKRRITYPLDRAKHRRIDELFFSEHWPIAQLPGYTYEERTNPFKTFAAIPAYARYQFMLDDAEYFVRTFIHGPVCRGEIATHVIRDHFWTIFQAPDSDLFVTDSAYQREVIPLLGMPGQDDDLLDAGENWLRYLTRRNDYLKKRDEQYSARQPLGAALAHVWDGGGENENALLTIFRHHNSASVVRGLAGSIPQTLWWMDYPLLERTYYELVANFNVYGNVAHQLLTRLYFDLIRNGAEHNFLRLVPAGQRKMLLDDWYQDLGSLKFGIVYQDINDTLPSAEVLASDNPKRELAQRILENFQSINTIPHDPLNRCQEESCMRSSQPLWMQQADKALSRLAARPASEIVGITQLPEVTFVRVTNDRKVRTVYTLLRNRAHSNVAFMLGEALRYQPDKDNLTVYPGIAGSYPNFIFDVPVSEIEKFSAMLSQADSAKPFEEIVMNWGIRRTHPLFWDILHDITDWQKAQQPLSAGIFDINRYENF